MAVPDTTGAVETHSTLRTLAPCDQLFDVGLSDPISRRSFGEKDIHKVALLCRSPAFTHTSTCARIAFRVAVALGGEGQLLHCPLIMSVKAYQRAGAGHALLTSFAQSCACYTEWLTCRQRDFTASKGVSGVREAQNRPRARKKGIRTCLWLWFESVKHSLSDRIQRWKCMELTYTTIEIAINRCPKLR